ncbi:hypothetical protein BDQ17DRAFT_1344798 [Cyathus striatus]|nr:hypothetical protein BDQ17DRAFT_1344798 [Cyathus striatus]
MTEFTNLPLELLPCVLYHLQKSHHLTSTCLVSKIFYQFSVPELYRRASIYSWHREAKIKVVLLFDTLSRCPQLAKYVRRLGLLLCLCAVLAKLDAHSPLRAEIRDFPKSQANTEIDIAELILRGLRNCINLRSCTWTRDGSLTSDILKALQTSDQLKELEINGHHEGNYDPVVLQSFGHLTKISLIMPSGAVVNQLIHWLSTTGDTLKSLTLICKSSTIITDDILESLAPNLSNLEQLHITGCPRVTQRGIWAVISANERGIGSLGLEGVSSQFGMPILADRCTRNNTLSHLRSITLTVHQQLIMHEWMTSVLNLLSSSPLEVFQVYSTGAFFESPTTDDFWRKMVLAHGSRLTRLSVHRMLISLRAIREICEKCPSLGQLFIVVEPDYLAQLAECLSYAKRLKVVHINYPLEAHTDTLPILFESDALEIVSKCSPTLTQFGCNAKVWQVEKVIEVKDDGAVFVRPKLSPYESPDIPEAFLVVRT